MHYHLAYRICRDCGDPVPRCVLEAGEHECSPDAYALRQIEQLRGELEHIEDALDRHLATSEGAFHAYLARREAA